MYANHNKLMRGKVAAPSLPGPADVRLSDLIDLKDLLSQIGNLSHLVGGNVCTFLSGCDTPTPIAEGRRILHRGYARCSQSDAELIRHHWQCATVSANSSETSSASCLCDDKILCYPLNLRHGDVDYAKAQVCFSLCPVVPSAEELASEVGIPEDKAELVRDMLLPKTSATAENTLAFGIRHLSDRISAAYAAMCAAHERGLAEQVFEINEVA